MYKRTYKVGYKKIKVCEYCGKRFENKHGLRKYCDDCKSKVDGGKAPRPSNR